MRLALALSLTVAALSGPLAAHAAASRIIFGCRYNLCAVSGDGSHRHRLTHDRRQVPYRDPAVSRDGRRIAFAWGTLPARLMGADGAMRHERVVRPRSGAAVFELSFSASGRELLFKSGSDAGLLSMCRQRVGRPATGRCIDDPGSHIAGW